MALKKLQSLFTLASNVTMTITEHGPGSQVKNVTSTAGDYYLSSSTAFISTLQTAINAAGLGGTYTVTLDDTASTSTGKVTISATGTITSFDIAWGSDT